MSETISVHQAATNLTHALSMLADNKQRTPCQINPSPWESEDKAERALAVEACQHCPIRQPCATSSTERQQITPASHPVTAGPTRPDNPLTRTEPTMLALTPGGGYPRGYHADRR